MSHEDARNRRPVLSRRMRRPARGDDRKAARSVLLLMVGVFLVGVVLYSIVAATLLAASDEVCRGHPGRADRRRRHRPRSDGGHAGSRRRPPAPTSPGSRPHAGLGAAERFGDPLPDATLDLIRRYRVALKGPCTTPDRQGLSLHQRPPAQGTRPLRQRPPGAARCPASRCPTTTSISSSSARTPRGCTPARSTSSCPAWSRACASSRATRGRAHRPLRLRAGPARRAGAASPSATRPTCCR